MKKIIPFRLNLEGSSVDSIIKERNGEGWICTVLSDLW
jgi:hypothetical protein